MIFVSFPKGKSNSDADIVPTFYESFLEVNRYFKELNEPLIPEELGQLFFRVMRVLLTPKVYLCNQDTANTTVTRHHTKTRDTVPQNGNGKDAKVWELSHEKSGNTFEYRNLKRSHLAHTMKAWSVQQKQRAESAKRASSLVLSKLERARDEIKEVLEGYEDEEAKLIANAKLPLTHLVARGATAPSVDIDLSVVSNVNPTMAEFDEQKAQLLRELWWASQVQQEISSESSLNKYHLINSFENMSGN